MLRLLTVAVVSLFAASPAHALSPSQAQAGASYFAAADCRSSFGARCGSTYVTTCSPWWGGYGWACSTRSSLFSPRVNWCGQWNVWGDLAVTGFSRGVAPFYC